MKQGQTAKHEVLAVKADMATHLRIIGQQVAMRQQHPFGLPLRAGGKQDHGGGLRIRIRALPEIMPGREPAPEKGHELVFQADLLPEILQIDHAAILRQRGGQRLQPGPGDKAARGIDHPDLGRRERLLQRASAGGEIQQRRHTADQLQGKKHHGQRVHVGQQEAHAFSRASLFFDPLAEQDTAQDQGPVAEPVAVKVQQGRMPLAELPGRVEQGRIQGAPGIKTAVNHPVHQRL